LTVSASILIERIMVFAEEGFSQKAQMRSARHLVDDVSAMGQEPDWTMTPGLEQREGQVGYLEIRTTQKNRALMRKGL
jgi:hypothetical protein